MVKTKVKANNLKNKTVQLVNSLLNKYRIRSVDILDSIFYFGSNAHLFVTGQKNPEYTSSRNLALLHQGNRIMYLLPEVLGSRAL